MIRPSLLLAAIAAALAAAAPSGAQSVDPRADGVYIVGALQRLHEREPSFTYGRLRDILDRLDPDLVVLEVRPDELARRTDTPGRPEYPAVVWPWLAHRNVAAAAMEPGGPTFAAMVEAASARFEALERDRPESAAYLASLNRSLSRVLEAHWTHPADSQDRVTRDLLRAHGLAQAALGGPEFARGQAEWDDYMIARTREAVAAHPGRRILVLASYRNLDAFLEAFRDEPRLADSEAWLRASFPE
ncbi:hypothetical protein [Sphingosinicella terrae]|uniref:hypothetical protein n=1 Tax=Sphingosinicella terrae TaxID=2172047 RepID=UPI000E0DFBEA|nr:hypothetical protein [Sphingosinicella terrae]